MGLRVYKGVNGLRVKGLGFRVSVLAGRRLAGLESSSKRVSVPRGVLGFGSRAPG